MIENNYDKETYKKMSLVLVSFTLFLWIYMSYVTYYSVFRKFYSHPVLNDIIIRLQSDKPNPIISMGVVILLYLSAFLTFSPTKTIAKEKKEIVGLIGFSSLFLFFGLAVFQYFKDLGFLGVIFNAIFFFGFYFTLLEYRKKVAEDLKKDRRNIVESQFDQKREKIETPYSVNIPYQYQYNGALHKSYINIVNPFRATLVGGTPGSGKSYATIEEMLRQFTKKGFTGVVYDFKFPTLSRKQYNYTTWYQNNYKIKPSVYFVNFDDPEYCHRCNPILSDSLETIADAEENTKVLMLNINKTWVEKEGDFFTDSANVFAAMLMWYLKILTKKYDYDVCSIPHLVALSTLESTEILFLILKEYNELKPKMKPFSEALEKGALEQLAGQVASAGVALSKISSLEMNYILTGDDFSFDLNDPYAPKIVCLGNNPDRQLTYSAPIGLILTKLAKTLNKQGMDPSMYVVDEFPTVYVRGIDNLIATGRSNKIATVLGFQSFAQIIVNYGKEISDQMLRICGTRIMGQMMDDDAKIISENIGKQKILNISNTLSANDISIGNQTSMEDIVPLSTISQFSQGTFCGVIADDFSNKNDNKIFMGELLPPLDLKAREEDLPLPKIYDMTPDNLQEQINAYNLGNEAELNAIGDVLITKNINDWLLILKDTTTERNFYELFIHENNFEYTVFKQILEDLLFRSNLKDFLAALLNSAKSKQSKDNVLQRILTSEEVDILIQKMIRSGICYRHKQEILQAHNDNIYNDIYRVVALEVQDLKIDEEIYKDKQLKALAIKFFEKIATSDRFNDEIIRSQYQKITEKLRK
ncbi:type IV secretion system DNA-binding domain-containing protein [Chryseobacterium oncorhynchi]|uniref:TraD/TraG TraM recognition site domain-containing protein n=1 Tax=Chryseobacterium oncorhynchi TaxID=741074 RepID=A0A316WEY3_9FLAO|nr:type IV secretion system DNA-binding domain-containing protein [Chryseobacterium oncorhynchi]PWN59971.1 hypothetical protein C1638_020605 [Chryseobacterium oncorhynchi]